MKRNKIIMLALAALMAASAASAAPPYSYTTVQGDPSGTRIYTLPNGLKVYLSVNKEKPRIQTDIAAATTLPRPPAWPTTWST